MSFYRTTLVALATLFTVGMTSLASACCDWGATAPVAYTLPIAPVVYGGGCGDCCGGCGAPTAAAVYAQPVAPAPIVVSSYASCGGCGGWGRGFWGGGGWGGWGGGVGWGGGYGWNSGCGTGCGGIAWGQPSPLYVVNQGPAYTGPGLMVPYGTYTPDTAYAPATDYPYAPAYGMATPSYNPYFDHLYYRPRYGSPAYMRARYGYGPRYAYGPRPYYHPRWH